MFKFVSLDSIRKDFDSALESLGYVRAKVLCDEWGITTAQFNKIIAKGFDCDNFIVNNVRYISVKTKKPEGF